MAGNEEGRHSGRTSGNSSKGAFETAINGFFAVIKGLPPWFQAIVVVGVLVGGGWIVYLKYAPPAPAPEPQAQLGTQILDKVDDGSYITKSGKQSSLHPSATDLQTLEAMHKAQEDTLAAVYHQENAAMDNPPIVQIGDSADPNNSLYYQFYQKTDRCLYVNRTEAGKHWIQWVLDPQYHLHDLDVNQKAQNQARRSEFESAVQAQLPGPFDALLRPVVLSRSPTDDALKGEPVQAGFCMNPHPGQFRFWWGPPLDQCNSPMYRQFADGCTHFQIFNRCSNAWNAQINWVTCNPPPHH